MRIAPIGHSNAGALGVDLDRLIGSHACIVANSGGGKSGLLRKLLEQSHGEVQHIVLDIEDEFYTLRERFDYVIAGGEGGDVPATLANAQDLARAALKHGFSMIVQMNDLGDDAPEFVSRFLSGLMAAPREFWRPLLIPIDEVQRFAPSGAGTDASAAVKDLLQRGRKRGFTAVLASLRISEIDPGVRGLCNNWLLGRVGQALDRRTMADQLGFTAAEGREKLRSIAPRHFWGFGPAIAEEPVLFGVDDVETTPVKPGQAKVATPPAPDALREILGGLAAAKSDDAGSEEDLGGAVTPQFEDVAKLHDMIATLRGEVTRLGLQLTEERAEGRRAGIAIGIARARAAVDALRIPDIEGAIAGEAGGEVMPAATSRSEAAWGARNAVGSGAGPTTNGASTVTVVGASTPAELAELTAGARKLIDALARHYPRALPIEHAAKIGSVSMKSSQWPTNFRSFADSGLAKPFVVEGQWELTTEGRDAFGLAGKPDDPAALLEFWLGTFPPSIGSMLKVLVDAREWLPREEIADRSGVSRTSSALGSGLKELRDHGLAEQRSDGAHRATKVLL